MSLNTIFLLLLLLNLLKPLNVLIDVVSQLLPQVLHVVVKLGGKQHHQVHQLLRASLRGCLLLSWDQPYVDNVRHGSTTVKQ